ncbi:MAG TPA: helix-turn-helix domain-containing protein [Candidatus Saccharimonadales bacterium]|jgi:AcrR family transcriptional regulator|nr:helix-turn-helix domain-containing protein [Candidatus Saccharimonadales bacterium]
MELADRPRQVRRPEEKLARLLVSARAVFERDGYARARIQEVCRNAGVSVGTFYEHFESKADLVLRIAELETEHGELPPTTSRKALEDMIAKVIGSSVSGIARAWLEAIEVEPELRIAQSRLRHAHLDRYTAWVRNARARRGGHAWAIDERATARAIIALLKDALTATYEPAAPRTRELARATWYLLFGE